MCDLEHSEICELKKQRIAEKLEQLIIDTILSIMDDISVPENRGSDMICHKYKCPDREQQPF